MPASIIPDILTAQIKALNAEQPTPPSDDGERETPISEHQTASADREHETPNPKRRTRSKERPQFAPPRIGEPNFRRYRLGWPTFKSFCSRPVTKDDDGLMDQIYDSIEHYGISDAHAAILHKLCPTVLAAWADEDPILARFLAHARSDFELDQLHQVRSFKRKDGQSDPYCARWFLERTNPERWGPPSARKGGARVSRAVSSVSPETSSPTSEGRKSKPPKPNTPEYWDYVEVEPFPPNTSTCIITPGMQKFYSILHMTEMRYVPDPDPADPKYSQRSAEITPEQRAAENEAFSALQEAYFSLPKDQRMPYLHQVYEQRYGTVLSAEERAAADSYAGVTPPSSSSASEAEARGITGAVRTGRESSSPSNPNPSPSPQNPPSSPTQPASTTPGENEQNIAEIPAVVAGLSEAVPPSAAPAPPQSAAPTPAAVPTASPTSSNQPPQPPPVPPRPIGFPARYAPTSRPCNNIIWKDRPPEKQPHEYTHEERVALFHEMARQEKERMDREALAFFSLPGPFDEREDEEEEENYDPPDWD